MANPHYDFKKGRFFIVRITDHGPIRLEGNTTYDTPEAAKTAAHSFLRKGYREDLIAICKIEDLVALEVSTKLVSKSV